MNSKKDQRKFAINRILKAYIGELIRAHKVIGVKRVIPSYFFGLFALISLLFTVVIPITDDFIPPTTWEKVQSRLITFGIMIGNLIVYGIVLNWRKAELMTMIIRIAFVTTVTYIDIAILGRTIYELLRNII